MHCFYISVYYVPKTLEWGVSCEEERLIMSNEVVRCVPLPLLRSLGAFHSLISSVRDEVLGEDGDVDVPAECVTIFRSLSQSLLVNY